MRAVPVVPNHDVGWTVTDAILVLLGTQVLSIIWASVALSANGGGKLPSPLPINQLLLLSAALWVGYGLGPIWVARSKGKGPVADFGARVIPIDIPVGLVLGVVTQLVVLPILYVPVGWFTDRDPSESARELIDGIDGWSQALLLVLATVVIAPLAEELAYRGLLLRALHRRYGAGVGVVVSAVVFALVHRDPILFPGLILFGAVAAGLALLSGRLGPSWAFHVGFNATTVALLSLAP